MITSKRYRREKLLSSWKTCLKSPQKGFFQGKSALVRGVENFSRSGEYCLSFFLNSISKFTYRHIKNSINDKIYCENVTLKNFDLYWKKNHTNARGMYNILYLYNKIFGPSKTSHKSWCEVRTLLTQLHFEISHYAKVKTSIFWTSARATFSGLRVRFNSWIFLQNR